MVTAFSMEHDFLLPKLLGNIKSAAEVARFE
jgi:hypothetical protein